MKSTRIRFSLATLLVAVPVVALLCWGYWHLLPDLREYQNKADLEIALRSLEVGPSPVSTTLLACLRKRTQRGTISTSAVSLAHRDSIRKVYSLFQPSGTYCVLTTLEVSSNPFESWTDVKVFAFPPMPLGYLPQTRIGRIAIMHPDNPVHGMPITRLEYAYLLDCIELTFDQSRSDVDLAYELIHVAPSPQVHLDNNSGD